MPIILTADWHLTDKPQDTYRWSAFSALQRLLDKFGPCDVFHLGDLADKKDKHSGEFVNQVCDRMFDLGNVSEMHIIMGNHDRPLSVAPVWNTLNERYAGNIRFHIAPFFYDPHKIMLLPFTEYPEEAWASGINFSACKAAFIHQPIEGAIGENGAPVRGNPLPILPRGIKIWAGDIHTPQKVGRVQYVGAPHPINFGDDYECRMLVLNEKTFEIIHTEVLTSTIKTLVEIKSIAELDALDLTPGDQIKVRFTVDPAELPNFAAQERKLLAWAEQAGIHVTALETRVLSDLEQSSAGMLGDMSPRAVLAMFGAQTSLSDACLEIGHTLLDKAADYA